MITIDARRPAFETSTGFASRHAAVAVVDGASGARPATAVAR